MRDYLKNITANSISTVWTTFFQLVSVPLFLTYWGAAKYGEWIVLNSFVVFFQMSDIGLNTASLNSFVINYQKGNLDSCKKIITNSFVMITLIFFVVFLVLEFLLNINFFEDLLRFKHLQLSEIPKYLFLLFIYTFIGTVTNTISSIYSATGKYSRGIMIDNFFKFLEGATLIVLLVSKMSIDYILSSYVIIRIVLLISKYLDSRRFYSIQLNFKNFNLNELREILGPSLAFFAIPISNTFIYQGFTLMINFYFGAASVVLYSTSRTLVNMIKAVTDIITRSIWPHISFAFAKHDFKIVRLYHSRTMLYSLLIFFVSVVFFLILSKPVYLHWTRGKSEYNTILITFLLVAMFFNLMQTSSSLILQATNQHAKYVIQYFLYYLLGLVTAFFIAKYIHNLSFLALGLIIPEVLLLKFASKTTFVSTGDNLVAFRKRLFFDFKYHFNLIKRIV